MTILRRCYIWRHCTHYVGKMLYHKFPHGAVCNGVQLGKRYSHVRNLSFCYSKKMYKVRQLCFVIRWCIIFHLLQNASSLSIQHMMGCYSFVTWRCIDTRILNYSSTSSICYRMVQFYLFITWRRSIFFCCWCFLSAGRRCSHNVVSTSMQHHDVVSSLIRRCFDAICPLGSFFVSWIPLHLYQDKTLNRYTKGLSRDLVCFHVHPIPLEESILKKRIWSSETAWQEK